MGQGGERERYGQRLMDGRNKRNWTDHSLFLRFPNPRARVIALHFNFIVCVYSIKEIVSMWLCQSIESKASEKVKEGVHAWQIKNCSS